MNAVKIPCTTCKINLQCQSFFIKRREEYDPDNNPNTDYNSESVCLLGKKCSIVKDFLFLNEVTFPRRNNSHYFWRSNMKESINQSDWIARNMAIKSFFEANMVAGTM